MRLHALRHLSEQNSLGRLGLGVGWKKWPQFLHWLTIAITIAYIPTIRNTNFVTYQNCVKSNVTASENNGAKTSKPCRNGFHGRSQTPQRPNVRYSTRVAGGMRALCSVGSLAWEGEGMAPGYHWRLIGMVFCGCFFVFWWPVVLAIILLLFL